MIVMEQLLKTGQRTLEHSRLLALLPQQPGLPAAYVSLLLDPADRLASACGALFSGTDSVAAAPSTSETTPTLERRHARNLNEQSPLDYVQTSRPNDWAAFFGRETSAFQSSNSTANITPSEQATRSRLPLSLVSGTTANPFASVTPQRAPFDTGARNRFQPLPEASLTSPSGSVMPQESPALDGTSRAKSDNTFHSGGTRESASALPDAEQQTHAALASDGFSSNHETSLASKSSTSRPAIEQAQKASLLSGVSGAHLQPQENASVSFTHNSSQLANMLNANLNANTPDAPQPPSSTPDSALQLAVAPPGLSQAREGNLFEKPGLNWSDSFAARENRSEDSGTTQEREAALIEAVLEGLTERLRLEFLRAYGTSGE
jgi:hypothetical protein